MDIITDTIKDYLIPIFMPILCMFIGMFFVRKNPIFLTKSESVDSTISKIKIIEEYNDGFRKSQLINTYFNISLTSYNALSKELHFVELLNLIGIIKRYEKHGYTSRITYDNKSGLFIREQLSKIGNIFFNKLYIVFFVIAISFILSIFFSVFLHLIDVAIKPEVNILSINSALIFLLYLLAMYILGITYFNFIEKLSLKKTNAFFIIYGNREAL